MNNEIEKQMWLAWQERFEYWKKFCVDHNPYVFRHEDWWTSRFSEDHPKTYGYSMTVLWSVYIAPSLGVVSKPIQLPLL